MTQQCEAPIPWADLLAYRRGELEPERETAVEEHYFQCPHCAELLRWLERLETATREAVQSGQLMLTISRDTVSQLRAAGAKLRLYELREGQSVNCTIAPEEQMVVLCLKAPLRAGEPLTIATDVHYLDAGGMSQLRQPALADPKTGEIWSILPGELVRAQPKARFSIRVVYGEGEGNRFSGTFTMNHSPWEQSEEFLQRG